MHPDSKTNGRLPDPQIVSPKPRHVVGKVTRCLILLTLATLTILQLYKRISETRDSKLQQSGYFYKYSNKDILF
ncbi:hypothetical protein BO71DRAFT_115605 [Aspergillus ellipticus CBS 707.79]|uniref:Uncharacterized protein n=1 Tax=Aspergillus ellipticus CBS 707.79 TaxID=1448320 RepID=A0A319DJG8_9EURO|nr:hypothetical protein BO71DRAFT_115605 [Aspergillus ellipticus CBS 707.79]